jgi:prepilin-type N-terminal cleavage/methylation domain-containing protein
MDRYRQARGFTLTEVMVAMVIGMLLIAASTATYISQNRSYVTQENVSEINTQSKIAHDMISNDIKTAGFGIPLDLNMDPVNGITTVITPLDSAAQPDAITIVGGFRMVGRIGPTAAAGTPCRVNSASQNVVVNLSGTDAPNTTDNRFVSVDGIDYAEVIATGGVTTLDRPLTGTYHLSNGCTEGRPVYLVEDVTYCVDANSVLRRIRRGANAAACAGSGTSDDEAIAENIEDLQFAYAVDAVPPLGEIDDLNGNNMVDGGDFVDGDDPAIVANPSIIRAVRINILARADKPDVNYTGLGNPPLAIENRVHGQPNDNFRRRLWQKIITIRNQWGQ